MTAIPAIPKKKIQEPQNGVKEGSPGLGNPEGMTQPWVKIDESMIPWSLIKELLVEMATHQHNVLLSCGRQIIPYLTMDDLLQPNDFLELDHHPLFRYQEGVLAGIQTVQMALQALKSESSRES